MAAAEVLVCIGLAKIIPISHLPIPRSSTIVIASSRSTVQIEVARVPDRISSSPPSPTKSNVWQAGHGQFAKRELYSELVVEMTSNLWVNVRSLVELRVDHGKGPFILNKESLGVSETTRRDGGSRLPKNSRNKPVTLDRARGMAPWHGPNMISVGQFPAALSRSTYQHSFRLSKLSKRRS